MLDDDYIGIGTSRCLPSSDKNLLHKFSHLLAVYCIQFNSISRCIAYIDFYEEEKKKSQVN